MKILSFENIDRIEKTMLRKIHSFLSDNISNGTVLMPSTVYNNASRWAIAMNDDDHIVGFSAQKIFFCKNYNIIQIMATFLSPEIKGKNFASILMQGGIFFNVWKKNILKPIFWCTRTRVPAVYAVAIKHNSLYPSLTDVDKNKKLYPVAKEVPETVYGSQIVLNEETYLIKNSYKESLAYLSLPKNYKNKISTFFEKNIDFEKNEAIFIVCRFHSKQIIKYFYDLFIFKINYIYKAALNFINIVQSAFQNTRSVILTVVRR